MIKLIAIIVYFSSTIYALQFDEFLNNALKNSPYLKSANLSIEVTSLQGDVLTRTDNPTLELELAQFMPKNSSNENGFRVGIEQPIRLWGVLDSQMDLASAKKEKLKAQYQLDYAQLRKKISLHFTQYARSKKLIELGKEELLISLRIYDIAQERFKAGTISRGEMLQAKVDYEMIEITLDTQSLQAEEEYFNLLDIAGYKEEVMLSHKHTFTLIDMQRTELNPNLLYSRLQEKEAIANVRANEKAIQTVNVFGEIENEVEQNVLRVGVAIPLLAFNNKSEEKRIAKLQAEKVKLLSKRESTRMSLELLKLEKQKSLLENLASKNEKLLQNQEELLEMYAQSYKIANINLLELQNIKNKVIQTKESLLKIASLLDVNIIMNNYIAGAYNE